MSPDQASRNTLADVLAAIETAGLAPRRQQDMASAVRTVVKALGQPADRIPADPRLLGIRLKTVSPIALGISEARWNNVRSLLRAALKLVTKVLPGADKTPLGHALIFDFELLSQATTPIGTQRAVLQRYGNTGCRNNMRIFLARSLLEDI